MGADRVRRFSVTTVRTPLKRPFITALGRKTETVNVGLTVTLASGAAGYGEASASLVMARLSPAQLARAMSAMARGAVGVDSARAGELVARAWRRWPDLKPAVAAFECALWQAAAASRGAPLSALFGGAQRSIESDVTLSADSPEAVAEAARAAAREGFGTLKSKVDGDFDLDKSRLLAAKRAAPRARFVVDGNQSLTVSGALRLVEAGLREGLRIELLEQPLPGGDLKGMAALCRRCPVPVAADESVMTPQDALRVIDAGAAGAINVKVAKSGIARSLEIAALARAAGLRLMIGCMAETARGLAPSVHLALGAGFFDFVDLDSDHLLDSPGQYAGAGWRREGPTIRLDQKSPHRA